MKIINCCKGPLTDKEAQVLRLLCQGLFRKQIAARQHRAVSTVSTHIESIARKLDAGCSAEIVAKAVALGLVRITLNSILLVLLYSGAAGLDFDQRRPPNLRLRVRTTTSRSFYR